MFLGAGAIIGHMVAEKYTAAGYKVAVVSRSCNSVPSIIGALSLAGDFKKPKTIDKVFEEVRKMPGDPSVVVYNGIRVEYLLHGLCDR